MPKALAVTAQKNSLKIGPHLAVSFKRTLRIPDDGKRYPLPPSLGDFPICRIEDYRSAVPESWKTHGGVFLPMWQREAMWLSFAGAGFRPYALKVAVGKVCAISGNPWNEQLHAPSERNETQDYVVVPGQRWLDGINVGSGVIRQFVAMPLGMGYTVEGQVTGEERFGGIQLMAFDSKKGVFPTKPPVMRSATTRRRRSMGSKAAGEFEMEFAGASLRGVEMGLAAGGQMEQNIVADRYGVDTWDLTRNGRVFVHIVNSQMYQDITGRKPPQTPIDAGTYSQHGLPWFETYDESDVPGSSILYAVKPVQAVDAEHGFTGQQDDSTVLLSDQQVHKVSPGRWPKPSQHSVSDGEW